MAEIKWIKLDTGIFEDEKIKIILSMPEGRTMIVVWLKILCLAGRINNSGVLMVNKTIPYTVEMLSAVFGEDEKIMRMAIDTFERLGMIESCNGTIFLPNWEKHQSEDALEKIRNDTRARVAKHRQAQRLLAAEGDECNVTVTLQKRESNSEVTQQTKSKTKNKNKTIESGANARARPILDDVVAYCKERGNQVDAQRWFDYYSANGWRVGKNPMKDWKAAVRTWEKNGYSTPGRPSKEVGAHRYDQRQYTESQLDTGVNDLVAEALRARNG